MTTTDFRRGVSAFELVGDLRQDRQSPYSAMIEVADRCNEVCVHCYQVQGQKGEMSTAEVCSTMDQLAEMGVIFLTFSGGEATLRADFVELVTYARKLRFAVKIYTNGLRVDEAMAQRWAELAVQEVQISLYSPRPEVHDWVTQVPGSHERTLAAARRLIEHGVRVVLKSPVMRFNADDRGAYIDLVEGMGAHYMLDTQINPREDGTRDPELVQVDHATALEVARDLRISGARELETSMRKPSFGPLCGACGSNLHIEANGEVRPCTLLDLDLGNALDKGGVGAAWHENTDAQLLRSLTFADVHGCRDCALQPYCHRCFANARTQGGDALGPYASACEQARLEYELAHGVAPQIRPESDAMGPYAAISEHEFTVSEDRLTSGDRDRVAAYPWLRNSQTQGAPAPDSGGLVQIRRPGARMPEPLQWPGASPTSQEDESGRANPTAAE